MAGRALVPIDHPYIDDHNVAERFVRGELPQRERESFERHYVDCAECMDRVALAQIFHVEARVDALVAAQVKEKQPPPPLGIFNVLATFTPRQQSLIFAAACLALLLMPVAAMNWFDTRTPVPKPETEPVIWLSTQSGAVDASIPSGANWISISATPPDQQDTYRISIVDVTERALITGPDQRPSKGTAIGLRLPSLPRGMTFALVEKRAENGAYSMVSRHPLMIDWR